MTIQDEWFQLLKRAARRTLAEIQDELEDAHSSLQSLPQIIRDGLGISADTDICSPLASKVSELKLKLTSCKTEDAFNAWLDTLPQWIEWRVNAGFNRLIQRIMEMAAQEAKTEDHNEPYD